MSWHQLIPQVQMIHLNYLLFQINAEIHGLGFSIYLLADILDYDKCDYVRRNHLMDFEIQGSKLYISVAICYVLKKAWRRWNITHYLRPCSFSKSLQGSDRHLGFRQMWPCEMQASIGFCYLRFQAIHFQWDLLCLKECMTSMTRLNTT